MKNRIKFAELRQLLLDLGFREVSTPEEIIFHHGDSETFFVFRPYRPRDPVADYNVIEVRTMLDSRGLMAADAFENQFRKTPA